MGFFGRRMGGPRRFNHKYIYVDERKEKLDKMEESAKRELGLAPEKEPSRTELKGKFIESTVHVKRKRQKSGRPFSYGVAIILIVILIFLWNLILTGEWFSF